jgi:thiol-disulfide isomerase/thioredoxin
MPSNRGVLLVALAAAIAGAAAGIYWSGPRTDDAGKAAQAATPAPMAAIGTVMPPLALPDLDGNVVDLGARFRGRPLLINVWASWCAPCVEEMPALDAFARAQGAHGVQVVGVALDTPEAVRDFLARVPVHYPIVHALPSADDASVRLGNQWGVLPYSVLIADDGRILRRKLGPFRQDELATWAVPGTIQTDD